MIKIDTDLSSHAILPLGFIILFIYFTQKHAYFPSYLYTLYTNIGIIR